MVSLSAPVANRLGFAILGLTNNFAYVIMLSAAYDLLKQPDAQQPTENGANQKNATNATTLGQPQQQKYCNEHSTSTILLADTLPSLTTKIVYPFLLVGVRPAFKAIATALLSAVSFLVTGFTKTQVLIFTGVACASFSSGLGESTFLSHTPLYGDVSLSGWSMGTGGAGLFGAIVYAVLRMLLSIETIMILMLVVPVAMLLAYFCIIVPVKEESPVGKNEDDTATSATLSVISRSSDEEQQRQPFSQPSAGDTNQVRSYGVANQTSASAAGDSQQNSLENQLLNDGAFDCNAKFRYLPSLAKYFLPLLLVYFAEYFINQGLFELIYYPEITFLDHAAQYRWFQVSYQLGVMISRSSLDVVQIRNLWAMSILQAVNSVLFLAHASKLIHIPSFYLVVALIIYEGLLGGFTYVNTFYRIKKEARRDRLEFAISTVTIADSLGIVMAGLAALPVHNALCKLYN